ncbi:tetratricopeptide repeat protein [bacterium]|nr:tetratricopeptide repeat protein [bacterium]
MNNESVLSIDFLERLQSSVSFSEALGLSESDLDQIAVLAAALYAENKLESSLIVLEGLTNLCPEKAEYWISLGAVLTRMERHEQAIPVLTLALRMNPRDTAALVNRGECYIALANNEKAAADLQKAIELDPKQQDVASNRARQLAYAMYSFFHQCVDEGLDEVEIDDSD